MVLKQNNTTNSRSMSSDSSTETTGAASQKDQLSQIKNQLSWVSLSQLSKSFQRHIYSSIHHYHASPTTKNEVSEQEESELGPMNTLFRQAAQHESLPAKEPQMDEIVGDTVVVSSFSSRNIKYTSFQDDHKQDEASLAKLELKKHQEAAAEEEASSADTDPRILSTAVQQENEIHDSDSSFTMSPITNHSAAIPRSGETISQHTFNSIVNEEEEEEDDEMEIEEGGEEEDHVEYVSLSDRLPKRNKNKIRRNKRKRRYKRKSNSFTTPFCGAIESMIGGGKEAGVSMWSWQLKT